MERVVPLFVLFAGATYHARGGWADLVGTFASLDEALTVIRERCALVLRDYRTQYDREQHRIPYPDDHVEHFDWWHIVELPAGKVSASGSFETRNEGSAAWDHGRRVEEDTWVEDLDPEQTSWWEG